jgi:hypothetical protein
MGGRPGPPPSGFKSCGACGLCCKLLDVPEIDKPAGSWCRHYVKGKGCGIHETRPDVCRPFQCSWTATPSLGEDWRPDRAHFILWSQHPHQVIVEVDPGYPHAWRREPYYAQLKSWSVRDRPDALQVLVRIWPRMLMIFPEADIDLGFQRPECTLDSGYRMEQGRRVPYARFVEPA